MTTNKLKTMRDVFLEQVYNRMHEEEHIFFLTADFGAPTLDKIREEFKDRFINVGIAEQNLINVATGLALEGYTVYAYAIASFITMRAYEQIRTNLSITTQIKPVNVNLIGVGAGVSYVVSGPTHHCIEDLSIMRLLPNFMIFSPSDWKLAEDFVDYSISMKIPKYIRFDAKPLPQIYNDIDSLDFEAGFSEITAGKETCLITTGYMTHRAINVTNKLNDVGLIDIFLLKPFKSDLLYNVLKKYEYIITIEEALINNVGLDSLISKLIQDKQSNIKLKRLGFNDKYIFDLGDRNHLHKINNIDEESIISAIQDIHL